MTNSRVLVSALLRGNNTLLQATTRTVQSTTRRSYNMDKRKERKEYNGRKLVGFSREQMYEVVADVANYKRFVPFCKKSTVIMQTETNMSAELHIGFPPIFESYVSHITLSRPTLVKAVCKDGRLFNYLETCWRFSEGIKSNPKSSIVDFSIDFQFKSRLHYTLANMFFEALVKQMESAFLLEAKKRYGLESVPMHNLSYVKT